MTSSKKYLATLGLLFGAVCWGVIWYPYRLMQEAGVSGVASSFYTYSIATLIGSVLFFRYWINVKKLPKTVYLLAVFAGWTNLSYVLAVIDGQVMRVMLLFYLSPLWTLVLAHIWLKEPINTRGVMTILISLIGAFVMLSGLFNGEGRVIPLPENQSEWFGLSAGIGFAMTNVLTRKSTHLNLAEKSMTIWLGVVFMSLIFMLVLRQPLPSPAIFTRINWLIMTLIAMVLVAATVLVQYGVTKLAATRASVIFLFELVVAAVASYCLTQERMQLHEWIGGAMIIVAALFAATDEPKD